MGVEEQKEEREVLDSIFPDEITGSRDPSGRTSASTSLANANPGQISQTHPIGYP